MIDEVCENCRGPLPIDYAANLHPDGTRTCLGACRPLHVFRNDVIDWVIAFDTADANAVLVEHACDSADDPIDIEWRQLPDDSELSIRDDFGELVTKTCAEWVASKGRCFLASTEF